MRRPTAVVRAFIEDEAGASLVEYGLLLGLIALAYVIFVGAVGMAMSAKFSSLAGQL